MLSNRNIESPLKTGKRSRERHASANRPNLVATLKYLSCHLKTYNNKSKKFNNSIQKGCRFCGEKFYKLRFMLLIGISFLKSLEMRAQKVQARKSRNKRRARISKQDTIPIKLLITAGLETVITALLPPLPLIYYCKKLTKQNIKF